MPAPNYNYEPGVAKEMFNEQIQKAMATGMSREKATSYVVKKFPKLQSALIAEANPDLR